MTALGNGGISAAARSVARSEQRAAAGVRSAPELAELKSDIVTVITSKAVTLVLRYFKGGRSSQLG